MRSDPIDQSGLTAPEIELIVDLLEREQAQVLSEIHFTSTSAYRRKLRQRFDLVEALLNRLGRKAA